MPDANLDKTALKAAVELGMNAGLAHTDEPIHYMVLPEATKVHSLLGYQYPNGLPPSRRIGNVQMRDSGSFCRYVELFRDERTQVFAEPITFRFLAVLDYHGVGDRRPEFLDHKASFQMIMDERWKTWSGSDMRVFSQSDFAEFIEDNMGDLIDPPAADMLEVARDLTAKIDVNFASSVRLQSGQVQLKYSEDIKAGVGTGNLQIPETFRIKIPVFYGEAAVAISARLRFRITQGKLTFNYKLYRPAEIQSNAFDEAVRDISQSLKQDVFLGTPWP